MSAVDPSPLFSGSLNAVLAFLLLVSGLVIRYLYLELKQERKDRLEDLRSYDRKSDQLRRESTKKEAVLYKKIEVAQNGKR